MHLHCSEALGQALPLNAGDDAKAVRWVDVGGPEHATLYADHKAWVDRAEALLSLHLPVSPCISSSSCPAYTSPYLPIPPHTSPYLPISP